MSATIGTKLYTMLYGKFVGRDEFGNRYFEHKSKRADEPHKRRWVVYNGVAEASKIPPAWHGWMHYTLDAPLSEAKQYNWLKSHLPNLTGTKGRYLPAGHISKSGQRAPAAADYEPWTPK